MKLLGSAIIALAWINLLGCASQHYQQLSAANNGAIIFTDAYNWGIDRGDRLEWTGGADQSGFAHGSGIQRTFGPDDKLKTEMAIRCINGRYDGKYVFTTYANDSILWTDKGTFKNGLRVGENVINYYQPLTAYDVIQRIRYYDGEGYQHGRWADIHLDGRIGIVNYRHGETISYYSYDPNQRNQAASSSSTDLGDGLIGLMSIAAGTETGDQNMVAGGFAAIQGNNDEAFRHYRNSLAQQIQNNSSGSGYGKPGASGGGQNVNPQPSGPLKRNLIDQYGLGRYRGASGDHITYYIQAADKAYESYTQSRNEAYYKAHQEYADIAKQFHEQTSTQGTRLGG